MHLSTVMAGAALQLLLPLALQGSNVRSLRCRQLLMGRQRLLLQLRKLLLLVRDHGPWVCELLLTLRRLVSQLLCQAAQGCAQSM
jgi:hypothetical protein